MASDLIENFNVSTNKIKIIFNPVDISRIKTLATSTVSLNKLTSDWRNYSGIKLLAAGRLSPEKGFDILIDAIYLCRDLPIKLLILGSGPHFNKLSDQVFELGLSELIIFEHFVENPYPFMALADGFVLSSHFEGFPNAVLEAATLGTPIIATPAPGGLFDIVNYVDGCHLASEINSDALAKTLRLWCNSSRERLYVNCTSRFNAPEIVAQYESVFFEALTHG
jgi:glycosyltransferase involved in cell wall biosynthesis